MQPAADEPARGSFSRFVASRRGSVGADETIVAKEEIAVDDERRDAEHARAQGLVDRLVELRAGGRRAQLTASTCPRRFAAVQASARSSGSNATRPRGSTNGMA
jgi:hypothetical protein